MEICNVEAGDMGMGVNAQGRTSQFTFVHVLSEALVSVGRLQLLRDAVVSSVNLNFYPRGMNVIGFRGRTLKHFPQETYKSTVS